MTATGAHGRHDPPLPPRRLRLHRPRRGARGSRHEQKGPAPHPSPSPFERRRFFALLSFPLPARPPSGALELYVGPHRGSEGLGDRGRRAARHPGRDPVSALARLARPRSLPRGAFRPRSARERPRHLDGGPRPGSRALRGPLPWRRATARGRRGPLDGRHGGAPRRGRGRTRAGRRAPCPAPALGRRSAADRRRRGPRRIGGLAGGVGTGARAGGEGRPGQLVSRPARRVPARPDPPAARQAPAGSLLGSGARAERGVPLAVERPRGAAQPARPARPAST